MKVTDETIEDAHWRTGLSRACLATISVVEAVPADLEPWELEVTVVARLTL